MVIWGGASFVQRWHTGPSLASCIEKTKMYMYLVAKNIMYLYIILLTLNVNIYCGWFRCAYSVTGCTTVWSWSHSMYVGDCVVRSIVKGSIGTVRLGPSPHDGSVWVCSGHCTEQSSCLSLSHFVWTWYVWTHFWFIYWIQSTLRQIVVCLCDCMHYNITRG